jgi:SWIM zinc finger
VQAALAWQAVINLDETARQCQLPQSTVRQILGLLGSRGLVGFDVGSNSYFSRQLPFDMELVEDMHPRLKAARKLVANGDIKVISQVADSVEAEVKGTDVRHRVHIDATGEDCTCQWHSKYQGNRGPCKHILAAKLVAGLEDL